MVQRMEKKVRTCRRKWDKSLEEVQVAELDERKVPGLGHQELDHL